MLWIRFTLIAKAAIRAITTVRSRPASRLSDTTSRNARSVLFNNLRATGMRSSS